MICHYISQQKRQSSNVSTKCQVASLVSQSFGFFYSFLFNYWCEQGDRQERGEAEMERDMEG